MRMNSFEAFKHIFGDGCTIKDYIAYFEEASVMDWEDEVNEAFGGHWEYVEISLEESKDLSLEEASLKDILVKLDKPSDHSNY